MSGAIPILPFVLRHLRALSTRVRRRQSTRIVVAVIAVAIVATAFVWTRGRAAGFPWPTTLSRIFGGRTATPLSPPAPFVDTVGDFRSAGTVDLQSSANWETWNGSSWVAAATAPNGNVISGNTITILSGHTWNNAGPSPTIPLGVNLIHQGLNGALSTGVGNKINLNGTYVHNTAAAAGAVINGMNVNTGSTFIYRGSSTLTPPSSFSGRTYYNLGFESTSGTLSMNFGGGGSALTVNGTLSIGSGVALTQGAFTGTLSFNGDIDVSGSFSANSYTVASSKTMSLLGTGSASINGSNTLTVNGTLNCGTNAVSGAGAFTTSSTATLGIGSADGIDSGSLIGNIRVTGTRTFDSATSYNYNGSVNQATGNGLSGTVKNFTVANTGAGGSNTVTLGSSPSVVGGDLSITSGVFDLGSNTANRSASGGTLTLASGAALKIGGTGTIPTNYATHSIDANSTIQFNGSNQDWGALNSSQSYGNVTIASSGTTTLTASNVVTNTLTLTSGAVSIGANTLTLNGAISTTSGTLTGGATSNITFGGAGANTTLPAVSGGLNALTVNRANGITLGGTLTVGGLFQYAGGVSGAGNLTLNGTARVKSGGSLTGSPTYGAASTLEYDTGGTYNAGAEFPATGVANVTLASTTQLNLNGNKTITGTMAVGANKIYTSGGNFWDVSADTITLGAGEMHVVNLTTTTSLIVTNNTVDNKGRIDLYNGDWHVTGYADNGTKEATVVLNTDVSNTIFTPTTFTRLWFGSSGGSVNLNADITVNRTLQVTNTLLKTNSFTCTLGSNSTGIGRVTGYVIGNLKKSFGFNQPFTMTVGTDNGYSPVDLNVTNGIGGSVAVKAVEGSQANVPGTNKLARYWTLSKTGSVTTDLTFNYLAGDVSGTAANYKIFKYDGSLSHFDPDTLDTANHFATKTGVSSFSDWTLAEAGNAISGTLFDTSNTAITSGKTITLLKNGGSSTSTTSDGSGLFTFSSVTYSAGDILTVYVDGDATTRGATVTRGNTGDISGLDITQDTLTVRHEDAGPITNANLATGNPGTDADLNAVYTTSSGTLTLPAGESLVIFTNKTFAPGGDIFAGGNWTNNGTFTAGANTVTFNGTANQSIGGTNGTFGNSFFATLKINPSNNATVSQTNLAQDATVLLNILSGTFNQGANATDDFSFTAAAVTVASGATWQNLGKGDLYLSGDLTNNGTINFNGDGSSCGDAADDIQIFSTNNAISRTWSGTGTFSLTDVSVQRQKVPLAPPPAFILVNSGTDSGNNSGFLFVNQCTSGTYTWIGGTAGANTDWQVPTNWSPTRLTPATTDTLIFDGGTTPAPIVTDVPTQTVKALQLQNGVNGVTLSAGSPATLTINGTLGSVFDIPSGNLLTLSGSNAITVSVTAGTGHSSIGGQVILKDGAHQLLGSGSVTYTFLSGSIFTTTTGFTGNPFGTGPADVAVFQAGSNGFFNAGGDPFGGAGNSAAHFDPNSTANFGAASAFSSAGRDYGNVVLDGNQNYSGTGSTAITIENNLTIQSGSSLTLSSTSGGDLSLLGNFANQNTTAPTFDANGRTVKFQGGSATQTVFSNAPVGMFFDVFINESAGGKVQLLSNQQINGQLNLSTADSLLELNGHLLVLSGTITGAGNLKGDSAASLSVGGNGNFGTLNFVSGGRTLDSLQVSRLSSGLVNLGNNLTVGSSLSLLNGILDVGSNTLSLTSAATAGHTNGYVVGNLQKSFGVSGNLGSFTFPVGTANAYSPLDANVTANSSGTLTLKAVQGAQPNIPGANALQRYWTLSGSGLTTDLTFHYRGGAPAPGDVAGTEGNYVVFKYDGSFTQPLNQSVDTGAHTATVTDVTSFSDWTLAEPAAVNPPETVLSVSGNNLLITDGNGGTTNDTLTLSFVTVAGVDYVRVHDPNHTLAAGAGQNQIDANTVDTPLSTITSITVDTQGGSDTLTLDLSSGDFIPSGGLSFAGGDPTTGPGDKLVITGGSQGTVTYNYTNAHDGNIVMSNFGTVSYTGLEPITNDGDAANIVFNLPAGPNAITLGDDGISNTSSRLSGATIETTDFDNPTGSLTINRGNAADTMTVNALPDFNASLTIGSGADPFTTITVSGTVTVTGAAAINLNGADVTGSGDISTGGGLTVNNTGTASTLSGVIGGTGSLTKQGAGTLVLSNANTYTGNTISGGVLSVGVIADSGTSNLGLSGTVQFLNGATLQYTGSGANTTTRSFNVSSASGQIDIQNTTGSLNLSGAFSGVFTNTLTKLGPGTLTFSGSSDNGSLILDAEGGTVLLAKSSGGAHAVAGISSIAAGATVALGGTGGDQIFNGGFQIPFGLVNLSGGTLDLMGLNETIDRLTGATGTVTNSVSSTTSLITIGAADGSGSFGGVIQNGSGTVALTKVGSGTLTLSGANTYTGTTTINGGTLSLSGAFTNNIASSSTIDVQTGAFLNVTGLTSGTVVLASGQTLKGNGTVSGKTTAASGSIVSPGASPGILNTGDVSFSSGSNFNVEINGTTAGTDYDQLNVTGTVSLGSATLNITGSHTPVVGQTFTIVNNDDTDLITGTFSGLPEGAVIPNFLGPAFGARISYLGVGGTGNDVLLTVVAADYTVTTTGNAIVVTDVSGNGDTLAVSEPASGQIKFAATGRSFLVDGATFINGDSGNLSLTSVTSITVDVAAGADTIDVGAFTTSLPSLTLNGGVSDDTVNFNGDLTFASNANLDVDLQNDNATPGIDAVNVASNANLLTSGTGTITVKVSRNVTLNSGSSFETVNGGVTVEANAAGTTAGNFIGINVNGGTVTTSGTGNIGLTGKGGNDASTAGHAGVYVNASSTVSSTSTAVGAGTITLNGTGGQGTDQNVGVGIEGGPNVSSVKGDISITGQGATTATGSVNFGISVLNGSVVQSTGTAKITLMGTGGAGTNVNHGARVGGGAQVTSSVGDIQITGQGGSGSGASHVGVLVDVGGLVTSTGAANVAINGTGGAGTDGDYGVEVTGASAKVTSSGGEIQIIGQGGSGSGTFNIGTNIDTGGSVVATGSANISISGTGGTGTNDNYGVAFDSASATGTAVSAVNGNIVITGISADATGTNQDGVRFEDSGASQAVAVTTTGTGTLTITGTAGNNDATSAGINLVDDTTMTLTGATNAFIADTMDIGSSNVAINAGSNALTLRQKTSTRAINLGAADSATQLGLTVGELDRFTAATINIGDGNSGAITVSAAITRPAATNLNLTSGANIDIDAGSLNSNGGNINLTPGTNVFPSHTGVDVTTGAAATLKLASGKDLRIDINNTTVDSGYTQLNVAGLIDLNGANLLLNGSPATPALGQIYTIVNNDGSDLISGTFSGLGEGAVIPNFLGSAFGAKITYVGGPGSNDVLLTVVSPEIAVELTPPGTNLTDNVSSVDFGTETVGVAGSLLTFTIRNVGTADLTIGAISKDFTNPADFTVNTTGMSATVTPGNSTTFTVTFTPGAGGARSAKIHIANDDLDENTFDITLTGTGAFPATLVVTKTADTNNTCLPGDCSLREAINAANFANDASTINFNIPTSDTGRFYYADDGSGITNGTLGAVTGTTVSADSLISLPNIDPDYPHSWWSIAPASPLPAITAPVSINGYTQLPCPAASPCSQANTDANADNAILLIEISGANPLAAGDGLVVNNTANGSRIEGLVINRFTVNGLKLSGNPGAISGNFIGTDVSGTKAAANNVGVLVDHGSANKIGSSIIAERNLISGNTDDGVKLNGIDADANLVQGNLIGTDRTGTLPLANGGAGVSIYDAVESVIGLNGAGVGMANHIARNGGAGVEVATLMLPGPADPGTRNVIRGNSIHDNGGLGIDLAATGATSADGVTPNDSGDGDPGANNLQNFPVIRTVILGGPSTIRGTLNSAATQTFKVDLYKSPNCNAVAPNDFGEGKTYLGSTSANTGANGDALWSFNSAGLTAADFITATATDSLGNTSEFSKCFQARTFAPGTISFAQLNTDKLENSLPSTVDIVVTRSGGSDGAVSVPYSVTDGSATTADNDYSVALASGTFTWANGDSSNRTITITVNGDTKFELDEAVNLTLSPPTGGAALGTSAATLTIKNDDSRPQISINDLAENEGNGPGSSGHNFAVSLSNPSSETVTVDFLTANGGTNPATVGTCGTPGVDYQSGSGQVSFAPGVTSQPITIQFCGDTTHEQNEQFLVNLTNAQNATSIADNQGIGTITNDDPVPAISINDVSQAEGNTHGVDNDPDATSYNFTVTLSNPSDQIITVDYATANDSAAAPLDYTAITTTTLTFNPGETSKPVTVIVNGDTTYELAEQFFVNLSNVNSNATIGDSQGAGTITNDDAAPTLAIGDRSLNEGTASGTSTSFNFTVTKTGSTAVTATVNFATAPGTATANIAPCPSGDDYQTQTGSLSFLANETTKTITVPVCKDSTFEGNETFFVNLSGEANATLADDQGQGTILNDDIPTAGFLVNTTDDNDDGVCNAAHCSLREAIVAANGSSTAVAISFAIPADDHVRLVGGPRHFYYVNDNVAGQVTLANVTATTASSDSSIAGIDPDWPHSWWSILPTSQLPATTRQVFIDGYSQTGATLNSATTGDNAVLRIELDGENAGANITGLNISGGTSVVRGLVINRFQRDGSAPTPTGNGLSLSGNNTVSGNFIGTDVSGTLDLGNKGSGISTASFNNIIGGATVDVVNLISGNDIDGITFSNSNTNVILGNFLGTRANGAGALGNSGAGISLSGLGSVTNTIGGATAGEGNTIAFNGTDGVRLGTTANFGNSIRGNSIFSNGSAANDLGIDLGPDGVTANDIKDPDSGPNSLQNFPIITVALVTGSTRTITGTLNSTVGDTFTIDFYQNASCDASGNGEGKTYLGSVTTGATDSNGDVSFTLHPAVLTIGEVVTATATATGAAFNTSEFSACFPVTDGSPGAGDIQFTSATYTVGEAGGSAAITVTRVGGSNGSITANLSTSDGTAQAPGDYTTVTNFPITYVEGEGGTKTVNVPIVNDTTFEGDETVNLSLGSSQINAARRDDDSAAQLAPQADPHVAVLTITPDSDPAPTLVIDGVTHNEGNSGTTAYTFTVTKTGSTELNATVDYATVNGTATAPTDFTAIPATTLTFLPADTTKQFTVLVNGDTIPESDESFTVHLSNASNATISAVDGTGTITNDDTDVSVAVSPSSVTEDGATNLVYTFTRSGVTSSALTVNFSVSGTAAFGADYSQSGAASFGPNSGTVTFGAGLTTATVTIDPTSDNTVELDETAILTLAAGAGYNVASPSSAAGTITNDDTDVSVAVSPSSVAEDGATNLVYTFTRNGVTSGALTVNFSVSGTAAFGADYSQSGAASFGATSGTVTFGAGLSTATVTIDPTSDNTVELDETAILTLAAGAGYNVASPSSAAGTITNDDTDVSVAVSPSSVAEDGATNLVYTFTRSGVTGGALTVNFSVGGSATLGTDYTQTGAATFGATSGTVTFGAGNSTAAVTVDPSTDSTFEPNETVILTVTSGTGYNVASPSAATGTITNDDVAPPALGNYANTSVQLGANTTITPDAAPTNTTSINVSTSTNFKGTFSADPTTGVVRVTNAHPFGPFAPGFYTVTVTAFNSGTATTTRTFPLTVQAGTACAGASIFTNAANLSVGGTPQSVAIGDFNNDGKQDIATANFDSNTVSIRLGDGAGGFSGTTEVSVGPLPRSVAIGDLNNDGKQDIAVANNGSNTVSIRLGDGLGGFTGTTNVSAGAGAVSVAIGDFNNDGKQDIAAANLAANTVSIRLGDGLGGFSGTTNVSVGAGPWSVAIGDFNNDGKQDIATANFDSATISIRLGDGAGGFSNTTEVSVGTNPRSVAIGDFNNDGKQDIAVANNGSATVSIRLGDGSGGFTGTTNVSVGAGAISVAIGDFNNDGKQDIAAANPGSNTVSIRLGDGLGGFSGTTNVSVGAGPWSVAIGDFNNDGKQDLAAANSNGATVSIRLGQCNLPPTIAAATGLQRQQGSTASNSQIATVTDDGGNGSVNVTVTSANPSNGVTISNIVNTGGNVTADIVAGCTATTATFTLQASDGSSTATDTLTVTVTANTAPTLTYASPQSVVFGGSLNVSPTTTGDNGTVTYSVQSGHGLTTVPTVNASGVVSITNAQPAGPHTITIRATDNCGTTTDASFTLNVGAAPTFTIDDVTHSEGNSGTTAYTFTVTKTGSTALSATVDYATVNGTATAPSDFTAIPATTLTFLPADTTKQFTVLVNGDTSVESNEAFTVHLSNAVNANISAADGTGTITNDDTDVSVAVAPSSVAEDGAANLVYTFTRNGVTSGALTVNFSVAGTATFGTDYTQTGAATFGATTGTVTFGAGNTTATVTIDPTSDSTVEPNETAILTVTSGTGYNVASPSSATGTITNDDTDVSVAVSPSSVAEDGAANLVYTFTRNGVTSGALTVNFSVAGTATFGTDYTQTGAATFGASSGTVTFGAGNTTATVTIDPTSDSTVEPDETAILTVTSGTGYNVASPSSATGTITNDDTDVSVAVAPSSVAEDGAANLVYTFTRNGVTSGALTVNFSVAGTATFGTDYTQTGAATFGATSGTVTFGVGNTTATVTIDPTSDSTVEPDETAILTVTSGTGYNVASPSSATGTITNDDTDVSVAVSPSSVAEDGAANLVYTFTRNGVTSGALTVNFSVAGTATFGTDYTQTGAATFGATSGTVTFGAGNSTATVTVDPTPDVFSESNETAILTVTSGTGYNVASPSSATGTITDDDSAGGIIRFSSATYNTTESSGSTVITVERVGDTTKAVTVDYATPDDSAATTIAPCATANGLASPRCDFTTAVGRLQFAAGEGSKTFTVLISQDNYVEGPETLTLTLSNPTGGAVFGVPTTATLTIADDATEPATNPIDDASNFVRQHYHDFLNREPDASGLAFWTNEITTCGTNQTCIDAKRINVSAAFYISVEFQNTGYLVERLYKTSYGDATGNSTIGGAHQVTVPIVQFSEFLPDTQTIGQGLIVGQAGWETVLENNKQTFVADFVQRSRFTTAYANTLTPAQFVDMLFANAGVTPTASERQAAIDEFGGAGTSANAAARGRALRRVAENATLVQQEFNRAFVLMQYFGYLRRNPNAAPDLDHSGYDFWLTKLNQFTQPGDDVLVRVQKAEMVKAFIVSGEYRNRFGP